MLTVAPMGRIKRLMCFDTPLFSSTHFIIKGRVAELGHEEQGDMYEGEGYACVFVERKVAAF